jgi:hypothetical protein
MILLLILAVVSSGNALEWNLLWSRWTTCDYTKEDAVKCLEETIDTNKDRAVSRGEFFAAVVENPSMLVRALSWAKTMMANKLFAQCDYNQDGVITARDLKLAEKTCLHSKQELCMMQWICQGLAQDN